MYAMQTGMISARNDLPCVFGYFPEKPKTAYLVQNNQKKAVFVPLENDDYPVLLQLLETLKVIINETELTSHCCNTGSVVLEWEGQNLSIYHNEDKSSRVDLGYDGYMGDPNKEMTWVIDNIIKVVSSHWDMLNERNIEANHIDLLRANNKQLNPNGTVDVISTSRMAVSEIIVINQWFHGIGEDAKLFLTMGNVHEIFQKCISKKDTFLDEFITALQELNKYSSTLEKEENAARYFRHDFKNDRLILAFQSAIWYAKRDEVPYYNALLVGQNFNNASRISFTANPCHIEQLFKMFHRSRDRLMSIK